MSLDEQRHPSFKADGGQPRDVRLLIEMLLHKVVLAFEIPIQSRNRRLLVVENNFEAVSYQAGRVGG